MNKVFLASIIKSKYLEIKGLYRGSSIIEIYLITLKELTQGYFRILSAKFYLRDFNKKGKKVSANGKPLIENRGTIIAGDLVRVWSNINRAKIFVGRGAILK